MRECEIIGDFVHYLVPRLQTYSADGYLRYLDTGIQLPYFCTYVHVRYWF